MKILAARVGALDFLYTLAYRQDTQHTRHCHIHYHRYYYCYYLLVCGLDDVQTRLYNILMIPPSPGKIAASPWRYRSRVKRERLIK